MKPKEAQCIPANVASMDLDRHKFLAAYGGSKTLLSMRVSVGYAWRK